MNIIDIIIKKRDCKKLSEKEINFFIHGYCKDEIKDYQISSLLMAIYLNGMDEDETYFLTKAIVDSGERIDFSTLEGVVVDKHSTGGVGDKTSLILVPLLASVGLKVAKMSGRGLGHTGGTIDKLEAIKGFITELSIEEFIEEVKQIGCALIAQSDQIAKADKKLYALRDVSGCIESIPLIVSSIMSKKIALDSKVICLDVKVGNGAFFKDVKTATKAANLMIKIGSRFNKKVTAVLSSMDQPLGHAIGNKIEVLEALEVLKGRGPKDLKESCLGLASIIGVESNLFDKIELENLLKDNLINNKAYLKFEKLVEYQGGTLKDLKMNYLPIEVKIKKSGYIKSINAFALGKLVMQLGGGRKDIDDDIDHDAGILIKYKIGQKVCVNDVIFNIYSKEKINQEFKNELLDTITVSDLITKEVTQIIKIIK